MNPGDDRRQHPPPGAGRHWEDSWYFDFAHADGSLGGFVRLGLRPADGGAWWWTCLAGARRPLVSVRDHDVSLPPGRALEIRASGLWAEITVETPLEHWSIGLEAFGVAMDDPEEAWGAERGDRVAVGLDLEWEAHGDDQPIEGFLQTGGYAQPCLVHGDVLIGDQRIAVESQGWRAHEWGERDWWSANQGGGGEWLAGHLDDGSPVCAQAADLTVTTVTRAPVLVTSLDGRSARLDRRLSRFETAGSQTGSGWYERLVAPA